MTAAPEPLVEIVPPWHRRARKIATWLVGLALFWFLLQLLGVNVRDWLEQFWDSVQAIPGGYTAAALAFQSGQTFFSGLAYYGILKAAYRDEVKLWPIIAAYSVGVAMNGFLPANIGTFVTLVMFVAIIPSCTIAGAIAAYLVQKIFYTIAGTFVYLYMFLSVPGAFNISFGNETSHPWLTLAVVAGIAVGLVIVGRIFWRQVKKLWAQAKEGGVILSTPKRYMSRVFLPSFLGWLCKIAVTGIFLAAFAIPVTFESIMWVFGSGSLANVASFTPGSIGVTQATNALALKTCCNVANDVAVNYSTAQQLITTAWNQIVAIVLVCWVFGWTGGKQLVGASYADAKVRVEETKAERKRKKAEKKAAKEAEERARRQAKDT
ncbi:MAG: hypothetical protein C5B48_06690 [Candidatus Rokuibacteriota bacterium]|nr:MAG: hypothetical protein C5B48_06690 [Candidatus Rokubacteria bacterium]